MEASLFAAFGLGLLLGIQHALDPDHLIAVTTIVSEHKNFKWASLIGACWIPSSSPKPKAANSEDSMVLEETETRDRDRSFPYSPI